MNYLNQYTTIVDRARRCKWASPPDLSFNGTSDYYTYNLTGTECFSDPLTIVVEFTPDFDADENQDRCLFDSTATNTYFYHDESDNEWDLRIHGSFIANIADTTVAAAWLTGQRNVLVISATSSDTDVWLNGTQILTNDASAWTPTITMNTLYLGTNNTTAVFFDGIIHSFKLYQAKLSATEAELLYDQEYYRPIIQSLIDESVCVLYHDYRTGSVEDFSGNENDGTVTAGVWTNSGLELMGSTSKVTVIDSPELPDTEGCILCSFETPALPATNARIAMKRGAGNYWDMYVNNPAANRFGFYEGVAPRTFDVNTLIGRHIVGCGFADGETLAAYYDGASVTSAGASTLGSNTNNVTIGNSWANGAPLVGTVHTCLLFNRKLTAKEQFRIYGELL